MGATRDPFGTPASTPDGDGVPLRQRPFPAMLAAMRWGRWSTLAAATIYVAVTVAVIRDGDPGLPASVANGLQLRPVTWVVQWLPPPEESGGFGPWQWMADALARGIGEVAHRPLADPGDRWRGAAAAAGLRQRHLVPVFLGPLGATDPAAERVIRWAFDPGFPGEVLAAEAVPSLPEGLRVMLLASLGGDGAPAARDRWKVLAESRQSHLGLLVLGLIGALFGGAWCWRSLRRHFAHDDPALRPRMTGDALLPPLQVTAFFAAVMVTLGVFGPSLMAGWTPPGGIGMATLVTYLIQAAAGIVLVIALGRTDGEESLLRVLGWRGGSRAGAWTVLRWGVTGWTLLWLFTMMASLAMLIFLGVENDPFENPVALALVLDPDPTSRGLLALTAVVVAPIFEETLFRGYLLNRFRRHFSPQRAAAIAGLLFALVHFSLASLVPLWALGFALGMIYQRTGSLWTPILAHGLWNLGTLLALNALFS